MIHFKFQETSPRQVRPDKVFQITHKKSLFAVHRMQPTLTFKTTMCVWVERPHAQLSRDYIQRVQRHVGMFDRFMGGDGRLKAIPEHGAMLTPLTLQPQKWLDIEKECILCGFGLLVIDHARMYNDALILSAWELTYSDGPGRAYQIKQLESML